MSNNRASIFSDDFEISDFTPKNSKVSIDKEGLKKLAESKGFSSRDPQPLKEKKKTLTVKRRNLTGRNKQLNIRVTEETFIKFYKVADENHWTLGETLEKCLNLFDIK